LGYRGARVSERESECTRRFEGPETALSIVLSIDL